MITLHPIVAEFPLTDIGTVEVSSLVCLRRLNAMDTAMVEIPIARSEIKNVVTAGSPIRLAWSFGGKSDDFYGYVHSYRPMTQGYVDRTVLIVVGAAYPLFSENGRTFFRMGIHNIAEQVCDDYRFQLETDPHPVILEQVLQKGESDWGLLDRLGKEWGYTLMMDGVTVVFRPMDHVIEERLRMAEKTAITPSISPLTVSGSLVEFSPKYQAAGSAPIARSEGSGTDPVKVTPLPWKDTSAEMMFKNLDMGRAVTSELEGSAVALAQSVKSRFPFRANALFFAPVGKKPMDFYRIEHDGKVKNWAILSVKHVVSGASYYGDMELGSYGSRETTIRTKQAIDPAMMLRYKRRAERPEPVIIDSRPYIKGAGASAVIEDQRWKALVRTINDGSEEAA